MTLKAQIHQDMKVALKAGDKDRLKVVRLIMAAIKQIEIDKRIELDDAKAAIGRQPLEPSELPLASPFLSPPDLALIRK